MEDGPYDDLCEALHDLADQLETRPIESNGQQVASRLRELAGSDTRRGPDGNYLNAED
jgi:hypothetical protein